MKSALASLISTALVSAAAAPLTPADAAGAWVQLLPAGTFTAIDGRGPFDAGDKTAMRTIVERTLEAQGGRQIPVDYDHQSVFGAKDGVGGRAPAAGWLEELDVRGDGIWARVAWTEAASAAIKAGEYKYISPVMLHTKAGKVLALRMAALTNTPAFDMAAVAASSLFSTEMSGEGVPMDRIAAALGLAAGSAEDAVLSALNAVLASSAAIAKAAGMADDAKPEDVRTAVEGAFAERAKISEAAGLKADARADDVVTTVAAAIKGGKPDPARFVPIEQVTELQKDVKSLQETLAGGKAEEAVAAAIKGGKLSPALKDWGLDLAKKDLKQFETFVGAAPVLTTPQMRETKRDGNDGAALDEAQTAVCRAIGLDPKEFAKTAAAEEAEEENR